MTKKAKINVEGKIYQDILDNLQLKVSITDPKTQQIIYANSSMKKSLEQVDVEKFDKIEREDSWIYKNQETGEIYQSYQSKIDIENQTYSLNQAYNITEFTCFEEAAHRDELTGIYNRRAGKQKLLELMLKAENEKKDISIVLFDINELRVVNEYYGHDKGDHLLLFVVQSVVDALRKDDLFFRLSGDEFIVAFYGEKTQRAARRIDTVLETMEKRCKQVQGENALELTYHALFSYGITEIYAGEQNGLSEIIARADQAMYFQKRQIHIEQAKRIFRNVKCESTVDEKEPFFEYDEMYLYDALESSTDDYIFVGNIKTGVFRVSKKMEEELGLTSTVIHNGITVLAEKVHPQDRKMFLESSQEIKDGRAENYCIEYRAKNYMGDWVLLRSRGRLICDMKGKPTLLAGFVTSLGKRENMDFVTGLNGRFSFEGDIKNYFLYEDEVKNIGVMVLDMDSFKNINDLYDRSFGDDILRITAEVIEEMLPQNAEAYRLDGDEFGIVIINGDDNEYAEIYATIHQKFQRQQSYKGRKYYCTLSAGYASYPEDADNYLDLVKRANYALDYSKMFGKNQITRFSNGILREKESKLEKLEGLRDSISRAFEGFEVYYQPQVNALTGELVGAEALARWHDERFGWVSPNEFIPLLEENGLILQLGRWVCERAIEKCKEWSNVYPDFHMSINLSYRQLQEGDFVRDFQNLMDKYELDPGNVTMELTETYLMKADMAVAERIERLRQTGVLIAMDDFGVGYSSLYLLKNMPVDVVKIDKGFVKDIVTDRFNATFIRSITELCHNVGRQVCLEGVEIEEEFNVIQNVGLDMIQGFYFGHPEADDRFTTKWLC